MHTEGLGALGPKTILLFFKTDSMPLLDRELDIVSCYVIDIVQLRRELKIVLFKGDTCPIAHDSW